MTELSLSLYLSLLTLPNHFLTSGKIFCRTPTMTEVHWTSSWTTEVFGITLTNQTLVKQIELLTFLGLSFTSFKYIHDAEETSPISLVRFPNPLAFGSQALSTSPPLDIGTIVNINPNHHQHHHHQHHHHHHHLHHQEEVPTLSPRTPCATSMPVRSWGTTMPPTSILPGSSDYAGHHYTCQHKTVVFHNHHHHSCTGSSMWSLTTSNCLSNRTVKLIEKSDKSNFIYLYLFRSSLDLFD